MTRANHRDRSNNNCSRRRGRLKVDLCRQSGGLWLDAGELVTLIKEAGVGLEMEVAAAEPAPPSAAPPVPAEPAVTGGPAEPPPVAAPLPAPAATMAAVSPVLPAAAAASPIALLTLPSLALRSLTVLVGLYAVLGLLLVVAVESGAIGVTAALLFAVAVAGGQFLLSPWLMDFSLRWFYQMHWAAPGELPEAVEGFVRAACERAHRKYPRIGIIEDGAPNAFTYGHSPGNARVVVTRGLFELLEPDELNAVIAHELGHARHWEIRRSLLGCAGRRRT
jgi:hypothetical protein